MEGTRNFLNRFPFKKNFNMISHPVIDLSPQEADRFITYLIDQSALKDFARIERMGVQQKNIRARGFGQGRMLYPANQFNESKYKKQWVDEKITLTTQELRGAIVIFDSDIEDISNIESEAQYKDSFMKLAAAKQANELEEAYWIGEAHNLNHFPADDIRGLWDGWRYQIVNGQVAGDQYFNTVAGGSHVLDACDGGQSGSVFALPGKIAEHAGVAPYDWEFKYFHMLKAMPSIYKANNGLQGMKFINSDLVTQDYIGALTSRVTAVGDAALQGKITPAYGVVGILDAPLMATNLGDPGAGLDGVIGAGNYTDVLLTPKDNLIIGLQRQLKMEVERKAADQANYIFFSMRVCVAIENVNAAVLVRCLDHAC